MRLQVALDTPDMGRAILVAAEVAPYADWLEAGYPLVAAHGVEAVRRLVAAFPQRPVMADVKIADHGKEIAKMASAAGARAVSVLATAADRTIAEVVAVCREARVEVMADLVGVEPAGLKPAVRRAARHDVDLVCFHVGPGGALDGLDVVETEGGLPVAVAGDLEVEGLGPVLARRPERLIVGAAITSVFDHAAAAGSFARALRGQDSFA